MTRPVKIGEKVWVVNTMRYELVETSVEAMHFDREADGSGWILFTGDGPYQFGQLAFKTVEQARMALVKLLEDEVEYSISTAKDCIKKLSVLLHK